jgi:DNA-binding transcriptional ArsR family regulator
LDQATISRHLAVIKQSGIVDSQRQGQEKVYYVVNPEIAEVCALMRTVLLAQAEKRIRMADELR